MISFTTVTWYSQVCAVLLGLGIFLGGIYVGLQLGEFTEPAHVEQASDAPIQASSKTISGFSWEYPVDRREGEIVYRSVYVVAKYDDGTDERSLVDTIGGDCNIDPADTPELALGSEQITCYYAGLGHKFRVIEEGEEYLVQERTGEEALPTNEGAPPAEFETKLTFPR